MHVVTTHQLAITALSKVITAHQDAIITHHHVTIITQQHVPITQVSAAFLSPRKLSCVMPPASPGLARLALTVQASRA